MRAFKLLVGILVFGGMIGVGFSQVAPATLPAGDGTGVETIVFFRHGEKPPGGLGQISAQGFNRALGLCTVLPKKFGKPDYLFAPDPGEVMTDAGVRYNYIRPLATIEPLAVALEMPVHTPCGYSDVDKLNKELTNSRYAKAVIFVAWEHEWEAEAARRLMKMYGGDPADIPKWAGSDFDSLYVVKITRKAGGAAKAEFLHEQEGLNGMSREMPAAARGGKG